MSWELKNDRPIYTQLMDQITLKIVSGEYKSGEKLPSVRDLAAEAAVNPNTMQKALTELERINLVYSVRTSGRFITEDIDMIKDMQENLAKNEIKEFLKKMQKIGFEKDRTLKVLEQVMKEME
ncbi:MULTISPECIES: GntR family transcriptional regulator [Clostridium]|uniref:DNA-binding transcriptional regulator YhcF, GntR family n=1 Tax=Clostridium cadaveris TaxID=1529 RepID=A0A1I2N7R3_9CLOT|nr:GntR family transcriptional regulator [Clostridium cadaveris]MDU4952218.1 GntR family transcriptional regulator [Clostridium sp.]MDM8312397.1 GntR family transcriptional regulator [Clostridium cadaveris]MDY4949752.1 GntR family transcriptional regulator [Clostridium cadaveris]NME65305.1 GntR family transcriptional regulator [Clostridium cadaveris]PWL55572.1 MAG: GntR family transcriptional regulator [Clostridium cadaveris]